MAGFRGFIAGSDRRGHGDARTYDNVCALRAVTPTDGMTADFYPYDIAFLGRTANRIINEVRGINQVITT